MGHDLKSEVGYSVGGTWGRPGIVTDKLIDGYLGCILNEVGRHGS